MRRPLLPLAPSVLPFASHHHRRCTAPTAAGATFSCGCRGLSVPVRGPARPIRPTLGSLPSRSQSFASVLSQAIVAAALCQVPRPLSSTCSTFAGDKHQLVMDDSANDGGRGSGVR